MKNDFGIIIVAGGSGSRYGEKNKLLEEIGGIPIIAHSPLNFRNLCPEEQIVVVCNPSCLEDYKYLIAKHVPNNSFSFITGGETRSDSVRNGLHFLKKFNIKYAAIHDAARPLATQELMLKCLAEYIRKGSSIAAKKVTDTIKSVDSSMKIVSTIDRTKLWAMETPQVFAFEDILRAYDFVNANNLIVTDDAAAMEAMGKEVYLVENAEYNNKITYHWDLPLANFIYRSRT